MKCLVTQVENTYCRCWEERFVWYKPIPLFEGYWDDVSIVVEDKRSRGEQKMADLPIDWVTGDKPPFTDVGVDLLGPFILKWGRTEVKRYDCIFTYLSTRAVHIELTHPLDTNSILNELRRFIERRGNPLKVRSDNGTNFVSGEKEIRLAIKEWNHQQINEFLLQRDVQWIFNLPASRRIQPRRRLGKMHTLCTEITSGHTSRANTGWWKLA